MMPTVTTTLPRPETIYFAYGSNLYLAQMAQRCPSSRYIGIGRLRGYRFQINQRGYANVVPASAAASSSSPPSQASQASQASDNNDSSETAEVVGLCYLLSAEDEARLDVNEGVAIRAYNKEMLKVEVFVASAAVMGRKVGELVAARFGVRKGEGEGETLDALVYLSRRFTQEGDPKEEYIERMNLGIADALRLGVEESYVRRCVRRYIPLG